MNFELSLESPLVSVAALAILLLTLAGGLVGLHLKNRVPGFGFTDNLRAMAYLTRYDAALEYHGLGSRERRGRVNELRADLAESAAVHGLAPAFERLGPPRVLAAAVAGDRMVPSWIRGALWTAVAGLLALGVLLISSSAFLAGAESAPQGAPRPGPTPLLTMTASTDQDSSDVFTLDLSVFAVAFLLVPFAIGARAWRLVTGRRTPTLES
jgi:hypothetical protein